MCEGPFNNCWDVFIFLSVCFARKRERRRAQSKLKRWLFQSACGGGRSKEGSHLYSCGQFGGGLAPADRTRTLSESRKEIRSPSLSLLLAQSARDFIRAGAHITCEGASLLLFIPTASDTRRPYQSCRNALCWVRGLNFVCGGRWTDNGGWFLWANPVSCRDRDFWI